MNADDERYKLLDWVKEYQIEAEIKDRLIDDGSEATIAWLRSYFDGWGEADWIAAYFTEK